MKGILRAFLVKQRFSSLLSAPRFPIDVSVMIEENESGHVFRPCWSSFCTSGTLFIFPPPPHSVVEVRKGPYPRASGCPPRLRPHPEVYVNFVLCPSICEIGLPHLFSPSHSPAGLLLSKAEAGGLEAYLSRFESLRLYVWRFQSPSLEEAL